MRRLGPVLGGPRAEGGAQQARELVGGEAPVPQGHVLLRRHVRVPLPVVGHPEEAVLRLVVWVGDEGDEVGALVDRLARSIKRTRTSSSLSAWAARWHGVARARKSETRK
jgi:hypothetical protein